MLVYIDGIRIQIQYYKIYYIPEIADGEFAAGRAITHNALRKL